MGRRRLAPRRDDATHGSDRVDSIRSKKRATRQRTNEWNDCFLSSGIEKSKGGTLFILGSRLYYSLSHEPWIRPRDESYATSVMMDATRLKVRER